MALKTSNKNRKKDEPVITIPEDQERIFGIDAPFTQMFKPEHTKWILASVVVAILKQKVPITIR